MTSLLTPTVSITLNGIPVVPIDGSLTLNEIDTYITADYVIPYTGRAQLAEIDVVGGVRTVVSVSELNTYDLGVRSYTVDHEARTVQIVAACDEYLLDDYAPLLDDDNPQSLADLWEVINYVLETVTGYIGGIGVYPGVESALLWKPDVDSLLWTAGTSAWNYLVPLVSGAGLVLYNEAPNVWTVRPTSGTPSGSVYIPYETVSQLEEQSSRDSGRWVTGVVVRYLWTTGSGSTAVQHEHIDTAGTPGRVESVTLNRPYPGQGWAGQRLLLLQAQSSMRRFTFDDTGFVLPGMTAQYYPGEDVVRAQGRVQSVTWPFYSGKVEVVLRNVSEYTAIAWDSLEVGESWLDSPVGESWIEEGA